MAQELPDTARGHSRASTIAPSFKLSAITSATGAANSDPRSEKGRFHLVLPIFNRLCMIAAGLVGGDPSHREAWAISGEIQCSQAVTDDPLLNPWRTIERR